MIRALLAIAACSVACVNVQDLGSDSPAPTPAAPAERIDPRPVTLAPPPEVNPASCPSGIPVENSACSNVAWCTYPFDGASGLSAKCGCSLGHWLCLRVRDDHRANVKPVAELPVTAAACTEGASCAEGSTCNFGLERWCWCTSSERLRCRRPTQ